MTLAWRRIVECKAEGERLFAAMLKHVLEGDAGGGVILKIAVSIIESSDDPVIKNAQMITDSNSAGPHGESGTKFRSIT